MANSLTHSYAAYHLDEEVRRASSSGGFFYAAAESVLRRGGVVYGAAFDENWEVRHKACTCMEELGELMCSKYVQSSIGTCFRDVAESLGSGKDVLFCGTPCQVAGLLSFLHAKKTDCSGLTTVDFICHGVPSRRVWRCYLKELSSGKRIKRINFRDKTYGWRNFSIRVDFEDGTKYLKSWREDIYMRGFIRNMILRDSCYQCAFRGIDRPSDFTIADFWGVHKRLPEMFDDKGTSIVMTHSEKASALLGELSQSFKIIEIPNDLVEETNSPLVRSVARNGKREAFFEMLDLDGRASKALYKYTRDPLPKRCKQVVKRILHYH